MHESKSRLPINGSPGSHECWKALFTGLWYDRVRQRFEPLKSLLPPGSRVLDLGCQGPKPSDIECGTEPYALLWTLGATQVAVVDKDPKRVSASLEQYQRLSSHMPSCFENARIDFLAADITCDIPPLTSDYFDLSYCEHVLRWIYHDHRLHGLRAAIALMARVLRRGGLAVACEFPASLPPCIEDLFTDAGFVPQPPIYLGELREHAYVFRKV